MSNHDRPTAQQLSDLGHLWVQNRAWGHGEQLMALHEIDYLTAERDQALDAVRELAKCLRCKGEGAVDSWRSGYRALVPCSACDGTGKSKQGREILARLAP
jgi:hypothetical protein